jgi:hypothetical protein
MRITAETLNSLVSDGKIFSVIFKKKTGNQEIRTMVARVGVAPKNPSSKGLTDNQKKAKKVNNLLTVYDMQKNNYRTISCDRILQIKFKGNIISRESLNQDYFTWEQQD